MKTALYRLAASLANRGWRTRRRPPDGHQPIVVVALEPVAADWFYQILAASLHRHSRRDALPVPFRVIRASSPGELPHLIGQRGEPTIVVADTDRWLWQLESCSIFYLRPHLLILSDIFPGIARRAGSTGGPTMLHCLDHLLCRHPTISLETLFHEPQQLAEYVNRQCGLDLLQPVDFPPARNDAYRKASAEILRIVEQQMTDESTMFSFPVGGTYATALGGAGCLALGDGWSWPETQYTWSSGARAVLAIRLAGSPGRRLQVQLDGEFASGTRRVRVRAGGRLVKEIWKGEAPAREQTITVALPPGLTSDPVLSIELEFSDTYCPKEAGASADERRLAFALRSFTITEETLLAAGLKSLVRWRSPRATLALTPPAPDSGDSLGSLLAESGLCGLLVTLAAAGPDRQGWFENGRTTPFPEFPAALQANSNRRGAPKSAAETAAGELRAICFAGSLPQLLTATAQRRSFFDLLVLSAGDLLGVALDALEPMQDGVLRTLPDIAVCTDEPAFFDSAFVRHQARYGRVIHQFAMKLVEPQLICFIGRSG